MKKLCLVLLIVLLLTGVADAGLHGTAWRDSSGIYYMGFYNGTYYSSNDGVYWIGTSDIQYLDFN